MERGCYLLGLILVLSLATGSNAFANNTVEDRVAKALNIFSVIKFPNDVCTGTNGFNGTCYTAEECTSKSGTSSGSCASGFGVCCTFSLSCGVTTSENNTYFEQTAFTTWSGDSPCKYKICPADGVCRIRLDLTTFVIAQPITRTDTADTGPGIGKCNVESMTVSSPGMTPPPEICGTNSGQHMFIDVNPTNCISVNINLDKLDTTTSRSWSIHAKQYSCGDTLAGPTGCLQYHTGSFGNFASFNWDMAGTTTSILSSTTHLAHQAYDICFRRESSMCRNCFSPKFTASFGVSFSKATSAAQAAAGASCTGLTGFADFVEIPGAQVAPVSSTSSEYTTKTTNMNQRICGLIFSNVDATAAPATASMTVCTHSAPFRMHVRFDDGEVVANGGNWGTCETCPTTATQPVGAVGFYMEYFQQSC